MSTIEQFRTGNPTIQYSGYPGSEFPQQCGGGYGYGGYGQYGTYGSCATYDHYNADQVDYNDGVSCGSPLEAPTVSSCNAPLPPKPATTCGPCGGGGVEGFADAHPGCAKPVWHGDAGCQMPPKHCGAGSCGYYGSDGEYRTHGQAGFETYDGAIGEYSPYAADAHSLGDVIPAGGCSSSFEAQHNPGCNCVKCMMPYSAPYHVGPGCGEPTCRCGAGCSGNCKCGAGSSAAPLLLRRPAYNNNLIRNLLIAGAIAYLAYRLMRRR